MWKYGFGGMSPSGQRRVDMVSVWSVAADWECTISLK